MGVLTPRLRFDFSFCQAFVFKFAFCKNYFTPGLSFDKHILVNLQPKKLAMNTIKSFSLAALFLAGIFTQTGCGGGNTNDGSASNEESTTKDEKPQMDENSDEADKDESSGDRRIIDKTGKSGPVEIMVKTPGNNMQNMRFDVKKIKLNKGQKVKLTLNNVAPEDAAAMKHNFVVTKEADAKSVANKGMKAGEDSGYLPEDKSKILANTEVLDQGEQASITFTIDEAGTYKYICTYPGHYPTMQGTIKVQ